MNFLKVTPILVSLLIYGNSNLLAQNFEWLRSEGTKRFDETTLLSCADTDGGIATVLRWSPTAFGASLDTLVIDTFQFIFNHKPGQGNPNYLIKYDSNGNVLNAQFIGTALFNTICTDYHGDIYLGCVIHSGQNIVGKDTLNWSKGNLVLAKFDVNFNFIWASQMGGNMETRSFTRLRFYEGHVLFIANVSGNSYSGKTDLGKDTVYYGVTILGKDTFLVANSHLNLFGAIDTSTGNVQWSKFIANSKYKYGHMILSDIVQMPNNSIYLSGSSRPEDFVVNGDSINRNSGFVIKTDSVGNYQKRFLMKGGHYHRNWDARWPNWVRTIATDGKQLIISGSLGNAIDWGGKKIVKYFDSGRLGYEAFIASLSPDLKEGFFYKPDYLSRGKLEADGSGFIPVMHHGYVYALGYSTYSIGLDSFKFIVDTTQKIGNRSFLLKLNNQGKVVYSCDFYHDTVQNGYLGNNGDWIDMGWNGSVGDMGWGYGNWWNGPREGEFLSGTNSSLFHTGITSDTIRFFPKTANSKGNKDLFVLKITDNIIRHTLVSKGPYCAGDTLTIPYNTKGIFQTDNYFIAELSNEKGLFDNTTRRIGVLKTAADSSILAVLPLHNIVSSHNYKIRIRSTRPAVKNDYHADTFTLTIYSKDRASAGLDFGICPGDTAQIHAKGGTTYRWSPSQNMEDSTAKTTRIWPAKTTKYRLIVSDTSGCSPTDTAYKTVEIRAAKIALNAGDTIVCIDDFIHLKAKFTGVDSTKYKWEWWMQEFGYNNIIRIDSGRSSDILKFHFDLGYSVKLRIMLENGCKDSRDTAEIKVLVPTPLIVTPDLKNRKVCYDQNVKLVAFGKGGVKPNYRFQWQDYPSGTVLGNKDTLYLKSKNARKILLKLSDGCMEREDTQYVNISVLPPLKVNSNLKDTTICHGTELRFVASGNGGDSSVHEYLWLLNGKNIGRDTALNLNTSEHFEKLGGTQTLELVLKDNCTAKNDTLFASIKVLPALEIQLTEKPMNDTLCFGREAVFRAISTGGINNYSYKWYNAAGNILGNTDTLYLKNNNSGISGLQSYLVVASDGCTVPADSLLLNVQFLKPIKAEISCPDSCLRTGSVLTVNCTGGDGFYRYSWNLKNTVLGNEKNLTISAPPNEIIYEVIVRDGCSADSVMAFKELSPYPEVKFSGSTDSGCELLTVSFAVHRKNQTTNEYRFSLMGSGNWRMDSTYTTTLVSGMYKPVLEVRTKLGCKDSFMLNPIRVFPKPAARYSFYPDRPVPKKPEVQFINRSTGAVNYYWNFNKFGSSTAKDPKISLNETGIYNMYLVAMNEHGCTDTSKGTIKVYEDYSAWIPNAFTPGNDNLNEIFAPEFIGVEYYTMSIYNRWGQQIFRGENRGWDGMHNGKPVPEGMYVYRLSITTANYEKVEEEGVVVVLIRD